MKKGRYFNLCLAVVFLLAGSYVLQESLHNSGEYAEEGILAGALLSALALVAVSWSIKAHQGMKALERHMKGR
jgi:hypothetical protein